jgi:hypothetical protein
MYRRSMGKKHAPLTTCIVVVIVLVMIIIKIIILTIMIMDCAISSLTNTY